MEVNNVNLNTPLYKGTNTFRAQWAAIRLLRLDFAILPKKTKAGLILVGQRRNVSGNAV